MRVYRIISAREITNMYKGINEKRTVVQGENTHKYENNTPYIHFFRYSEFAEYYLKNCFETMNSLDNYIAYMTANIPNDILRKRIGYGFYDFDLSKKPKDILRKRIGYGFYDCNLNEKYYIPIPEYAIKCEEFKSEYIVEINSFINDEYKNTNGEYKKYLELIKKLANQYSYDFHKIAEYLESQNLEELLGVKDDDRTEKEIFDDHIKKLSKMFPLED